MENLERELAFCSARNKQNHGTFTGVCGMLAGLSSANKVTTHLCALKCKTAAALALLRGKSHAEAEFQASVLQID